jgi:hypothetical protein
LGPARGQRPSLQSGKFARQRATGRAHACALPRWIFPWTEVVGGPTLTPSAGGARHAASTRRTLILAFDKTEDSESQGGHDGLPRVPLLHSRWLPKISATPPTYRSHGRLSSRDQSAAAAGAGWSPIAAGLARLEGRWLATSVRSAPSGHAVHRPRSAARSDMRTIYGTRANEAKWRGSLRSGVCPLAPSKKGLPNGVIAVGS